MQKTTAQLALSNFLKDGTLSIAKITPHDLRRTVVTQLSDLGAAPYVIEKVVNHKTGGVVSMSTDPNTCPNARKRSNYEIVISKA